MSKRNIIDFEGCSVVWARALQSAGVGLSDLSFVETHDCFTIAELIEYEAMSGSLQRVLAGCATARLTASVINWERWRVCRMAIPPVSCCRLCWRTTSPSWEKGMRRFPARSAGLARVPWRLLPSSSHGLICRGIFTISKSTDHCFRRLHRVRSPIRLFKPIRVPSPQLKRPCKFLKWPGMESTKFKCFGSPGARGSIGRVEKAKVIGFADIFYLPRPAAHLRRRSGFRFPESAISAPRRSREPAAVNREVYTGNR